MDLDRFTRATATVEDVLPGERAVVAVVNTDAIDRFKTVIDPAGMDRTGFLKNPVVLWEHGKDREAGVCRSVAASGSSPARPSAIILAKTVFGEDDFSDSIFRLYQDGTLKGFSIDGLPDAAKCSPPSAEEVRKRPDLVDCRMVYRRWELLEVLGDGRARQQGRPRPGRVARALGARRGPRRPAAADGFGDAPGRPATARRSQLRRCIRRRS